MKREYIIETNEGKIYPLGVTKTPGGFDVAFVSEKSPALLLFEKGSRKRMARLAFPENARMGNVHFMTVKGDFTGLEYAFEEDGKEISDPLEPVLLDGKNGEMRRQQHGRFTHLLKQ